MKKIYEKCDAVVIGTGAGGAPFAKELVEGGAKVIILERGREFLKVEKGENLFDGAVRVFSSTRAFRASVVIGTPPMVVGYGFCTGGSTAINAGTCFRPPSHILKKWREEYGLEIFTDDYIGRIAEEVETFLPVKEVDERAMGMGGKVFARGIKNLGWSGGVVKRNADGCLGCGACVAGCPVDAKKATHLSYLPLAVKKGAKLFIRAKAERILIKNGRVEGVEGTWIDENGEKWKLEIRSSIVAAGCGAVHTPILLKRSIGSSPGVIGKNFRLHPGGVVGAIFDEEINCWRGVPQSYYCDEFLKEDMILLLGAIPPPLGANLIPGFGMIHKELMAKYRGFIDAGVLVSDTSCGEVLSIRGVPVIRYKLHDIDFIKLKKGMNALAEIFFAGGAKYVFPLSQRGFIARSLKEFKEGMEKMKKEDMICGSIHPMGTARMGRDKGQSFVNQFLESHIIKGLFVVDASVLPTSTIVNPQETIMILSTHAGKSFVNRR